MALTPNAFPNQGPPMHPQEQQPKQPRTTNHGSPNHASPNVINMPVKTLKPKTVMNKQKPFMHFKPEELQDQLFILKSKVNELQNDNVHLKT